MRVLIVEDKVGKLERIIRILEKNQMDYEKAHFLEDAMKLAASKDFDFDFLITDIFVPQSENGTEIGVKNGFEMVLELAKKEIRIPTIFYTCCPIFDDKKRKLEENGISLIAHVTNDTDLEYHLVGEVKKGN